MKAFDEKGAAVDVDYDPKILAFVHEGMEIRNPMRSECDRFSVDPRVDYGFVDHVVDDVCVAWLRELPEGGHHLLTDLEGGCPPLLGSQVNGHVDVVIARHDASGSVVASSALSDVPWAE